MITPRISNCDDCSNIEGLIEDINCKIFNLSMGAYSNIIYGFRKSTKFTLMYDLLHYRRILEYKAVNSDYLTNFSVGDISNKVRLLIGKS
jgi:hypothetical protein